MQEYDPIESFSVSSYEGPKFTGWDKDPKIKRSKFFHRFVLAVLVGAVIGLLYVNWYEAQVIQAQRHVIYEMWDFIQAGCPTSMLH